MGSLIKSLYSICTNLGRGPLQDWFIVSKKTKEEAGKEGKRNRDGKMKRIIATASEIRSNWKGICFQIHLAIKKINNARKKDSLPPLLPPSSASPSCSVILFSFIHWNQVEILQHPYHQHYDIYSQSVSQSISQSDNSLFTIPRIL